MAEPPTPRNRDLADEVRGSVLGQIAFSGLCVWVVLESPSEWRVQCASAVEIS